ncbi:MAG: hypothetical protein LBE70_00390 [Nitrososphaerota archaeon]|nr:hypothetical protein [Nitrososphaerota archaeon]
MDKRFPPSKFRLRLSAPWDLLPLIGRYWVVSVEVRIYMLLRNIGILDKRYGIHCL